jgi:hypothetical protein
VDVKYLLARRSAVSQKEIDPLALNPRSPNGRRQPHRHAEQVHTHLGI